MKAVALYNLKGGVGKSTAAVNLACLAALGGARTLMWDLDPQGAAGYLLSYDGSKPVSGKRLMKKHTELGDVAAHSSVSRLDVVAAALSNRNLDILLDAKKESRSVIAKMLDSLRHDYDLIFVDCPAGITLLAENIFNAMDNLIVPVIPTPLSARAYEEIVMFFDKHGIDRAMLLPFFSQVQARKRVHREMMETFRLREPGVCATVIPFMSEIERMSATRRISVVNAPKSPAAQAYASLWNNLKAKIRGAG